ncbi:MAG: PTPDL family protein [Verrucomicrobiota bacterium]
MKISPIRTALLALLCGTPLLHADILMLKNGTKVEGSILEQNDQGVKMRYRLTPKIMDEKIFPMTDIDKVVRQTPQEVEVIELRKLLPTPNLLKADAYEQIIQDRLRPFVNKYPGTPEAQEVETMITKLQEEKTMVSNGQIKHEGRWLSPKEFKAEQWNIEAYLILANMREKAAKQEYVAALREFDKLLTPPPAYKGSTYYVQAIPEAMGIMDKWIASLDKMSGEQPQLDQARKEGLKKLQEPDLSKTKNAITDEFNKWRAGYDAERRQKLRWTVPYKYDLPSIQFAQKEAVQELTRLQTINLDELRAQNELFTTTYRKIGEGDYLGGAAAFERVSGLNLTMEYRDIPADLRNRLLKLHAQLSRAAATGAAATSGSAATSGVATGQDSRVAQILAEAGATSAPAASGQPAMTTTTTTTTAPAVAPAPAAVVAPQPVAPQRPVAPVAQQPVPQAPVPPMPMPMPAPAPVVEESNTSLYIMIGMGVVIVGLILAFLKKK